MNHEIITVANLKCNGCANTIRKSVAELQGVQQVLVDNDASTVTVDFDGVVTREEILTKLNSLGYPEATAENGLLTQAKSYVSCMIGRIN
jgi:copper chaperone CopZ